MPATLSGLLAGIMAVILVTGPDDIVDTRDWLRPRLWGGTAVLPVESSGHGYWRSTSGKNTKMIQQDESFSSQRLNIFSIIVTPESINQQTFISMVSIVYRSNSRISVLF